MKAYLVLGKSHVLGISISVYGLGLRKTIVQVRHPHLSPSYTCNLQAAVDAAYNRPYLSSPEFLL
ncbi:uncharacterized protein Bfra_000349 [Botrytis fragariae]|uniref:Uncharacterized protein n=1 Tax=Botrytis fragariae TaxID=1964551 RepID=A0A8H6B2J0_9HELO|nr:uncharacterized protein Bfra_000349 [Botrytis fragariae]KAF5878184.1 hypothetical protein Bfra_000349 [Botrytis fragariae]